MSLICGWTNRQSHLMIGKNSGKVSAYLKFNIRAAYKIYSLFPVVISFIVFKTLSIFFSELSLLLITVNVWVLHDGHFICICFIYFFIISCNDTTTESVSLVVTLLTSIWGGALGSLIGRDTCDLDSYFLVSLSTARQIPELYLIRPWFAFFQILSTSWFIYPTIRSYVYIA
jgi:hypothetical protein